jgi:hypothetical protein
MKPHVTTLSTSDRRLNALLPRIKGFLDQDYSDVDALGTPVRGYRSPDGPSLWLRDHTDMMRGFRYWERDMKSMVGHFAETQTQRGWLFDYFTLTPDKLPSERENWAKYVRVPVEADVEYRFVNGVYLAWQATGDDVWMASMIPHVERALEYILTDPSRWDAKSRLVKRAYTIDTWDFDYTAGKHDWLNFQITPDTFWGIMHGDLSGYYQAFLRLALMLEHLRRRQNASYWRRFAASFRRRANALCFNGMFYTHHVHLVPVEIAGVDATRQLSLSNPMDINRGLATHAMAVSIIDEYRRRGEATGAFAPWFSIDPPFPDGIYGEDKLVGGAYCNGGIMPLVGGELIRAAFDHGREAYAMNQLLKYHELTQTNETFLWYFPDGRHATKETSTSPEAYPTDGWGASAMLYALMEGLAGIVDDHKCFERVTLSPRWCAADQQETEVMAAYGASGASFGYRYRHDASRSAISIEILGNAKVRLHLLLPAGTRGTGVRVNGRRVPARRVRVEQSSYVDLHAKVRGGAHIEVSYREERSTSSALKQKDTGSTP